ncbi:MAG TPA: dienelactone hydrolase family protein [Steroidobacteraceae bacterium]
MTTPSQDTLEIETGREPTAAIIWMHGLGADAHDFEPIVPELAPAIGTPVRFVFPNAPVRPITVNAGYPMRAWFDIIGFGEGFPQDEAGIRASAATIRQLIEAQNARGIPTSRIVLAGFSQGAAMAVFTGTRYPERLAGILALSGFPLLPATLDAEAHEANAGTPVFIGHGTQDPLVPPRGGEEVKKALESRGHPVEWHAYPMPHSVSPEEVRDIASWLHRQLAPRPQK